MTLTDELNERLWRKAVHDLHHCGFITEPQEITRNVYAASHTGHGFGACARELACNLPGQLWPGKRSVSWVNGGNGPHGRLIDSRDIAGLQNAQKALKALKVDCFMPWSTGRMARALMLSAVEPNKFPANSEKLLDGVANGYHDCKPGTYKGCPHYVPAPKVPDSLWHSQAWDEVIGYKPKATMYDVSSYYYRLLCRMPSPRLMVGRRLHFEPLLDRERGKWKEVLDTIADDKLLRNSMVGTAMGAKGFREIFKRDKARPGKSVKQKVWLPGGPFRAAGLLIVRSAYELCHEASLQTDSIYSTIDSVTVTTNAKPTVWEDYGLWYNVKAAGDAHIVRRGCWAIGEQATKPYKAGFHAVEAVPRPEPINRLYYREWLQEC